MCLTYGKTQTKSISKPLLRVGRKSIIEKFTASFPITSYIFGKKVLGLESLLTKDFHNFGDMNVMKVRVKL